VALKRLKELSIVTEGDGPESRNVLEKCAGTALNSKLISGHKVREEEEEEEEEKDYLSLSLNS